MYYRCKHFQIQELVSPKFYARHGDNSWWWIDPRLCAMLDRIHELTLLNPELLNEEE